MATLAGKHTLHRQYPVNMSVAGAALPVVPLSCVHRVGEPKFEEAYAYISEVKITPYKEKGDANYPQILDQPGYHPTWTTKNIAPPLVSRGGAQPSARFPGSAGLGPLGTVALVLGALVFVSLAAAIVIMVRRAKHRALEERVALLRSRDSIGLSNLSLEEEEVEEEDDDDDDARHSVMPKQ